MLIISASVLLVIRLPFCCPISHLKFLVIFFFYKQSWFVSTCELVFNMLKDRRKCHLVYTYLSLYFLFSFLSVPCCLWQKLLTIPRAALTLSMMLAQNTNKEIKITWFSLFFNSVGNWGDSSRVGNQWMPNGRRQCVSGGKYFAV